MVRVTDNVSVLMHRKKKNREYLDLERIKTKYVLSTIWFYLFFFFA